MSESFRTTPPEQQWSGANSSSSGYQSSFGSVPTEETSENEVGKALLVGLLGGLVSAAGYVIYRRLPDDQKERLNSQVRGMVQQRISEIRQNFNI